MVFSRWANLDDRWWAEMSIEINDSQRLIEAFGTNKALDTN